MTGGGASRKEMLHLANRMGWQVGHDIILIRGDAVDRQRAFEDPDIYGVAGRTHYLGWAETSGFKPMPYASGQTWYEGGVAISRRFLEEQPDAVRAIVVGLEKATAFILDETNGTRAFRPSSTTEVHGRRIWFPSVSRAWVRPA